VTPPATKDKRSVGEPGEFEKLPQDLDAYWQRRRDLGDPEAAR